MKKLPAQIKASSLHQKNLQLVLPVVLSSIMASIAQPAHAADRVLQVLGVCGAADAQYEGNRRHARSRLISFGPEGFAGILIEGVEGLKVDALRGLSVVFTLPDAPSTFTLRIKTKGGKIQNFSIGDESSNLPNIPTGPVQGGEQNERQFTVQQDILIGGKSKLNPDDTIAKYSFLFSCNKKNSRSEQFVDSVFYGTAPVSLVLDPITCNLK
jgi:hypothetical protein